VIRAYIARDSKFYAQQMIRRIIVKAEAAAISPARGHPVHEYPEASLKEVHEHPYRIIYFASADAVHIVTVIHFKQHLDP
jgi:toxin ParE1/3/4